MSQVFFTLDAVSNSIWEFAYNRIMELPFYLFYKIRANFKERMQRLGRLAKTRLLLQKLALEEQEKYCNFELLKKKYYLLKKQEIF